MLAGDPVGTGSCDSGYCYTPISADRNKARALELIDRVLNRHDVGALNEFTSNPAVVASGASLLRAFPDLEADVRWIVVDGDMTVVFHDVRGTQQGPWLFVQEPTGRRVETSFVVASGSMTMGRSWISGWGRISSRCSPSSAGASRLLDRSYPEGTSAASLARVLGATARTRSIVQGVRPRTPGLGGTAGREVTGGGRYRRRVSSTPTVVLTVRRRPGR